MLRILIVLFLVGCGSDSKEVTDDRRPTPEPPGDDDTETSFADMQALHQEYCIACHASSAFTQSEQQLKGSSAKQRVQNKSMPPPNAPKKMSDEDRENYLSFFFS